MKFKFVTFGALKDPASSPATLVTGGSKSLPRPRLTFSLVALVLANLLPIAGVLFFGWSLFELLYLYVLEAAVMGIYNIPKVLLAQGTRRERLEELRWFLVGSGLLIMAEFAILVRLFGGPDGTPTASSVITNKDFRVLWERADVVVVTLIALFVSHGISFYTNFLRKKEYLQKTAKEQTRAGIMRIVLVHVVLGFGGTFLTEFGSAVPLLALLGFLKIIADVVAHRREHAQVAARRTDIPFVSA